MGKLNVNYYNFALGNEEKIMEFNITKCKVLHVGKNNPLYPYTMNDQELKSVDNEKDIGVIVDKTLKPTKQLSLIHI